MLPDLLEKNLKLVICGTALGNTSAKLGQYYARPGNKFWFGPQPDKIGMTQIFVAPSTSRAASKWWDLRIWQELAQFCNR